MKKLITLVLALVCVLGLVGCNQKAVSASEVYSFPEPTTMITVSFYSQGEETAYSAFRRMVPYAAFHYPVISLLVVAAIVLLVCLATPVITFMQNVKQSVVERLRQN